MLAGKSISSQKKFSRIVLYSAFAVSFIYGGGINQDSLAGEVAQKDLTAQKLFTEKVSPEQKLQNLKLLLAKHADSKYAPLAVKELIKLAKGEEKVKYLNLAIDKYLKADLKDRDKVKVGVYAGKTLFNYYLDQRKMEDALEVANRVTEKSPKFKNDRYFQRLRKGIIDNLSLKDRLGKFVFDKKTGLGEFVMQIDRYINKYTLVKFYVPVDSTGKVLPEASDILMYIPWTGEARRTFKDGINKTYLKFAQREKMTVFTFTNWCNLYSYHGDRYFPIKEAGWYPYVFEMKKRIEQKFGLESRKLFISGQSSGGSMSQRLTAVYPDKIAAAAWNWGTNYVDNMPEKMPPMLIVNNWSGWFQQVDRADRVANALAANGNYVLRGYGPPRPRKKNFDYHGASDETFSLIEQFIADLRNLRKKNGGKIPPYKNWYKVTDKSGKDKYYSSEEFYNKWKQLPLEAIAALKNRKADKSKLLVYPQLTAKPDRVVLYVGPKFYYNNDLGRFCTLDVMYGLAKSGAVAVAVNPGLKIDYNNTQAVLNKIFNNKDWKDLDVYIVGVGVLGGLFVKEIKKCGNKRLKEIKLFNPESSLSLKDFNNKLPVTVYFPKHDLKKAKYYKPTNSSLKAIKLITEK